MLDDPNPAHTNPSARGSSATSGPARGLAPIQPLDARLRTIGPDELAQILGKERSTVLKDVFAHPEILPPRFKPPGSNKILWLESVVVQWVQDVQMGVQVPDSKRRTGRRRQVPA